MAEKEETEAMATQFSSLDVVDDVFSELPEHIIHRILGFLPSIKDIVRTSAISKLYLQAWGTFPIRVFDSRDFVSGGEDIEGKSEQNFISFVDSYLRRFRTQNGAMKTFNINMSDHTTRWVGMALENKVEHLALQISMDGTPIPCLIPESVLSVKWLKSLRLYGPTIYIPLNEINHVDLPSLTNLLVASSNISDEQLQKLLSGCPVLQCIELCSCESLSKIDIFNQPNLEILTVMGCHHLTAVRVRAPKLKSFWYTSYPNVSNNEVVEIHNSPELKRLRIGILDITDAWFNKFIAQFPLLEDLKIDNCKSLRKIRISNPLLEKIEIISCPNLKDVSINCKKLASFSLRTETSSISNPISIQMEMDHPPSDCTTRIFDILHSNLVMEASWYCKLKEFLTRPVTYKSLILGIIVEDTDADGDMKGEDVHKRLPPAACNIESLMLGFMAPRLFSP